MNKLDKVEEYKGVAADLLQFGYEHTVNIMSALAILLAGFIIAGWVARLVRRRLEGVKRFDKALIPVVAQIVRYAVPGFHAYSGAG